MRMNEIGFEGQAPIDGYGPGGFRIAGAWHEGALLVGPGGATPLAVPLSVDTLAPVLGLAGRVDVVLFGQGADMAPLQREIRAAFETANLGVETMSTPSACRTYNVLLSEARRVAAVLIPVEAP